MYFPPSRNESVRKRSRACEECHRLKIKCDPSTSPEGSCDRCSRNHLVCKPAAPRLQRDRINELEAQIEELKHIIREKSSSTTPGRPPASSSKDCDNFVLSFLDARIPSFKRQELLDQYANQARAAWPMICTPLELDSIRAKSPMLLLSVLVYTITHERQSTELEVHDELVREAMHLIGDTVIGRGQRSIEIVQVLLIAAFWNKPTLRGQQGSCYQLIQLAVDMAIDLGIAVFAWQPSPVAYFTRHENPTSPKARRTWLACFVALSTSSTSMRRPNTVPWNDHHQECLLQLEITGDPADILLGQIVRIIQLIEEIHSRMRLCQLGTFVDGNDYDTHVAMEDLRNKVDGWAAQIPPSLAASQTLKVWYHVAMVHVYEVVLHTPTNKGSFAAPFIPGRIAVKDIPRPTHIILPLKVALGELVQNCQAVIGTASVMNAQLVLDLPTFCFAPTVLYSLYLLVTALVAATDPNNTYGQCLPRDRFGIEECSQKLRSLTIRLQSLDPTMSCWTTRLVDATGWLEEWYKDYAAILMRYESKVSMA